jgi:polyphosphate kinase 2 (PPK2 family)
MGFCTQDEYEEFLRFCPSFEQALQNDGIVLVKYWLSVSDAEQERRFEKRLSDPRKRWKFSPIDLQARARWVDYAEAKDRMFAYTDIEASPWYVVEADDKRTARLNLISHLLSLVPYEHLDRATPVTLPPRQDRDYLRPPKQTERLVPTRYTVRSG